MPVNSMKSMANFDTSAIDDRLIDPQPSSPLFRLPTELRLRIYEDVLAPTKTRSLYITRDVWAWKRRSGTRKYLNTLLVCRWMYDEALDVLYSRHELQLYTDCTWELQSRDLVRYRVCGIENYVYVFQRAHSMRLTLFVTGDTRQDKVIVALLAWLKAVLSERQRPLKLLTLEFCALNWKLHHQPTAILYAAQGFRSLGPTKFVFQCGFTGVGSEGALETLMQHANEKIRHPVRNVSKEAAFEKFLQAWRKSRPYGYLTKFLSNR